MIGVRTLNYLNAQSKKDATVLFEGSRYGAAVYLMGYAIEYALKRRICLDLEFNLGFPELNSEFSKYSSQVAAYNAVNKGKQLNQLRQIKNHRLGELLSFSGMEKRIRDNYFEYWNFTFITMSKREAISAARSIAKRNGEMLMVYGRQGKLTEKKKYRKVKKAG
jgi:hypothetical protein